MRGRIAESTRAFAQVFANPDLRRLQLAWAGSLIGNWSYFVALAIYAYAEGGAGAVGIVSVIRMIPAAIASPFLAGLADRYPRKLVMIATRCAQSRADDGRCLDDLAGVVRLHRLRDRRPLDRRRHGIPPGTGRPPPEPRP